MAAGGPEGGEPAAEPAAAPAPPMAPSSQGPDGPAARLRREGEALLPAARAVLMSPQVTPQQGLGALTVLCDVVDRLLCHLEDADNFDKYRRVKAAALRKRLGKCADHALSVLELGGFSLEGEHFVWDLTGDALFGALALQATVAELQRLFQSSGPRAAESCRSLNLTVASVLAQTDRTPLLTRSGVASTAAAAVGQCASAVGGSSCGPLLQPAWLEKNAADLFVALRSLPSLADAPNAREKALCRMLRREMSVRRDAAGCRRTQTSPCLEELAQLMTGFERVCRRSPHRLLDESSTCKEAARVDPLAATALAADELGAEPSCTDSNFEAANENLGPRPGWTFCFGHLGLGYYRQEARELPAAVDVDAGDVREAAASRIATKDARQMLTNLLRCIPAFRLGIPHAVLSEIIHLREFPSFFGAGTGEKQFEVSLGSIVSRIVGAWVTDPMLLRDWSAMGAGCSADITHDDCALVWVIFA